MYTNAFSLLMLPALVFNVSLACATESISDSTRAAYHSSGFRPASTVVAEADDHSQARQVVSDGADHVGANRVAADGADHVGANRVAADGADHVDANRVAAIGADRVGVPRSGGIGSDAVVSAQQFSNFLENTGN